MTGVPTLRENWYRLDVLPGFDLDQSGIIEWRIEGHGIEVGQATRIRDRLRDAEGNLRDMLSGGDYHNPGRGFRDLHKAMFEAYQHETQITLVVLETCNKAVLAVRRRYWLESRRAEERAAGPKVLNSR